MSGHDDFAFEPVPGLPAHLPPGEEMLWQGRPSSRALAMQAYKLPWIALWCGLLTAWKAAPAVLAGAPAQAVAIALPYLALGLLSAAILYAMAVVQARSTVYTVTSARVVMRVGAALPVTFNLPFAQVASAALDLRRDGSGTIALALTGTATISRLVAWPHVRPGLLARTEPALRCIPDAARVAQMLSQAAETRMAMPVISRRDGATAVAAE